ncbi:hypothetical protein [Mycolicibacterium sp. P9-64]|nr:hypothetical protein [Mycolicibacterium sp. P9-64]
MTDQKDQVKPKLSAEVRKAAVAASKRTGRLVDPRVKAVAES